MDRKKSMMTFILLVITTIISNAAVKSANLPLEDIIDIGDRTVPTLESLAIQLPSLPSKPGKIIVLRFDAYTYMKVRGGCSFNLEMDLNDHPIKRLTASGDERIIGRKPVFHISHKYTTKYKGVDFALFSGKMIRLMFAPDVETANQLSQEGQGAFFALNISDVARGVDGNILTLKNTNRKNKERKLIFKNIQIGWLDKKYLPKTICKIPVRASVKEVVSNNGTDLFQGKFGGFSVKTSDGLELLVETAINMNPETESSLIASDKQNLYSLTNIKMRKNQEKGFSIIAKWSDFTMNRSLSFTPAGNIQWCEKWTNTSKKTLGLPFRHRLFLREGQANFFLAGSSEFDSLTVCSGNPTMFIGSRKKAGRGLGVTLENDWLRLLARLRKKGGVGEIYTEDLALPPGGSIDFSLTITPVRSQGYWTFINSVRERWGVNNGLAERPTFWMVAWAPGKTIEERVKKSLGHLGPINFINWGRLYGKVSLPQWVGLGYDGHTIVSGNYPKLSANTPRAPGKTPDLDIDKYLTFEHREPYWLNAENFIKLSHRACPDAKVLLGMHPAILPVYMPLFDRWPYAKDVIKTEDGKPFQDGYYSQAFLSKTAVEADWATPYFVPRSGSVYLQSMMQNLKRGLDKCNSDGFYLDEFSWNGSRRYSRYDYGCWDGYSATLDSSGKILKLKSDNAFTTEEHQVRTIKEVNKRRKYFLCNGSASLRKVNNLCAMRFTEGGNGVSKWRSAHLASVPLIYANFGEFRRKRTTENLFKDVKAVIEEGCLYSPTWSNLALDGPDNFVCKLYPISIMSIWPGTIIGKQRLITTHSGSFQWHDRDIKVKLYVYDEKGVLQNRKNLPIMTVSAGMKIKLDVPAKGMIIAEIMPEK